jgi:hypothetical protein
MQHYVYLLFSIIVPTTGCDTWDGLASIAIGYRIKTEGSIHGTLPHSQLTLLIAPQELLLYLDVI